MLSIFDVTNYPILLKLLWSVKVSAISTFNLYLKPKDSQKNQLIWKLGKWDESRCCEFLFECRRNTHIDHLLFLLSRETEKSLKKAFKLQLIMCKHRAVIAINMHWACVRAKTIFAVTELLKHVWKLFWTFIFTYIRPAVDGTRSPVVSIYCPSKTCRKKHSMKLYCSLQLIDNLTLFFIDRHFPITKQLRAAVKTSRKKNSEWNRKISSSFEFIPKIHDLNLFSFAEMPMKFSGRIKQSSVTAKSFC